MGGIVKEVHNAGCKYSRIWIGNFCDSHTWFSVKLIRELEGGK